MLSILIPTYNFDCLPLISELATACDACSRQDSAFDYEILVLDDASPNHTLSGHVEAGCSRMPKVRWMSNVHNEGRSRSRATLLTEAQGKWVLMVDDDARLVNPHFITNYWSMRHCADVICGDLVNPAHCPPGHELRHRYERSAEPRRTASKRNRHPYERFTTFNFMALRSAIAPIGFNPDIREYGYEDVLLGFELQARGVSLLHTDNPLLHTGIDSNAEFLSKTRAAMRTLATLPLSARQRIGASRLSLQLERCRLRYVAALLLRPLLPLLEHQLLSHRPCLFALKLYKLGYFLNL